MQDYYDKYWKKRKYLCKESDLFRWEILTKELVKLSAGKKIKVLDCGGGGGMFVEFFREHAGKYADNIDIEVSDISKVAKTLCKKKEIQCTVCDAEKMPFKKKFDIVLLQEVIAHTFHPEKVVNEIFRVLKKGGNVIVTTPNRAVWYSRLDLLRGNIHISQEQIRLFTVRSLTELLKSAGFHMEKVSGVSQLPFAPTLLKKDIYFKTPVWKSLLSTGLIVQAKK